MPREKEASKRNRVTKAAVPALGAAGLTFWARRRRFRVNHADCGRPAEIQLHTGTNNHAG